MAIWEQFVFTRTASVKTLQKVEKEMWDKQPSGFPNTIRWNAGHIFATVESMLQKADSSYESTAPSYVTFFSPGTKPSEWTETAPSSEEIIHQLQTQVERIKQHFDGRLDEKIAQPISIGPLTIKTIHDILSFSIFHEGLHLGIISSHIKIATIDK